MVTGGNCGAGTASRCGQSTSLEGNKTTTGHPVTVGRLGYRQVKPALPSGGKEMKPLAGFEACD
jgi:hypothetical protein